MIELIDPLALQKTFWPRVTFYDKQREIVYSVLENVETHVPAGNKLGKDFVASFICLWFFLAALKAGYTCRVLTSSVKDEHLDVLWGEMGRWITTAEYPLMHTKGGPLVVNYHEIRKLSEMDAKNPLNYLKGQVSKKGEGLAGHHAQMTLFVGDEASGLDDVAHEMAQGWAQGVPGLMVPPKRFLYIGNPNDCSNFFRRAVAAGDLAA